VTTPSYASEPAQAAISMDRPEAFDHFIERAFRHELDWFDDAPTDAESCLPAFGLVDPINRRETEDDRFLPVDFALEAHLVSHDVFRAGTVLHVKSLPYVRATEATPKSQPLSSRVTSNF